MSFFNKNKPHGFLITNSFNDDEDDAETFNVDLNELKLPFAFTISNTFKML